MCFFEVSFFGFAKEGQKDEERNDYQGQTKNIIETGIFLIDRQRIGVCLVVEFHGYGWSDVGIGKAIGYYQKFVINIKSFHRKPPYINVHIVTLSSDQK